MELTTENVRAVCADCLYTEGEDERGQVLAEGIVVSFGFHPERLKSHFDDIRSMLSQLPETFHKGTGDGWHFTCAYKDRNGKHWGEHKDIESLVCLGIASGLVRYIMPRDTWYMFPGGLPYFVIALEGFPK